MREIFNQKRLKNKKCARSFLKRKVSQKRKRIYKKFKAYKKFGAKNPEEPDDCIICLNKENGALLARAECGQTAPHRFHELCLQQSLRYDGRCPICRVQIVGYTVLGCHVFFNEHLIQQKEEEEHHLFDGHNEEFLQIFEPLLVEPSPEPEFIDAEEFDYNPMPQ